MREEMPDVTTAIGDFAPDYAIPPGATLIEVLDDQGMSQSDLARRTGLSKKHVSQIANGRAAISVDVALKFEKATGVPAHVWNNLESRYRERVARADEATRLQKEVDLLDEMPIAEMVRRGLLTKRTKPAERLREVYAFFAVSDRNALLATWATTLAEFRNSRSHKPDHWAATVWLRLGELSASEITTEPFNLGLFRSALDKARALTTETDPRSWHPKLVELCAASGVAVAVVDEVPGARTHGAARWLAPEKALIQLSIRYRWSDIFWFSFFHEAKHVIDLSKRVAVLEYTGKVQSEAEQAADKFAADFLIPPEQRDRLCEIDTPAAAVRFADVLGIHPGIVVGRLQHDGWWRHDQGNQLRQRLRLVERADV